MSQGREFHEPLQSHGTIALPQAVVQVCTSRHTHKRDMSWWWRSHILRMTTSCHAREQVTSHVCVRRDMAPLYLWHDSSICVTWLIYICDMTHVYVCHDSFICVTWLIRASWHACMSVAVCCSVLQCVAVRCSALQCAAVRCSGLQCASWHGKLADNFRHESDVTFPTKPLHVTSVKDSFLFYYCVPR